MFKPVIVVPCYNHADAFEKLAVRLAKIGLPVIVIDDGSVNKQSQKLKYICNKNKFQYIRNYPNGGKGMAMKVGLKSALKSGYTHALQIDADGQHDINDVESFLDLAEKNSDCAIIGNPVYDASAPFSRLIGRKITNFWVAIETMNFHMPDVMCGFRVYPLKATCDVIKNVHFNRMGFDIEILVKLYWCGIDLIKKTTRVIYPVGGISNFRVFKDNVYISLLHTYLCILCPLGLCKRFFNKHLSRGKK